MDRPSPHPPSRPPGPAPRIVVTLEDPATSRDPEIAERKNRLYLEAIRRHGGEPIPLTARSGRAERDEAFAAMDGLLFAGGADLDPRRYGERPHPRTETDPERDTLEWEAWKAADVRRRPVLGICRGLQAINVFAGGRLVQHVEGHSGRAFGTGPATTHPLRVVAGTKLARILFPKTIRGGVIRVNTFHHQAVRPIDIAPGLIPNAWAPSRIGDLVEGLESPGNRFVLGVQCHPERTESTPEAFERLFAFFLDAARGPAAERR
ncbi:MAG TPA: gamma-glutamyl-gamma-aminobutyrate hydrolase family protein [Candidatus Limnocylindrales bacterium]|nr:gamma-glutamyl-gamma-aminobutyrate hydrolase family protein [Candidatus Limnocylindrales bacterium]